MDYRKAAEVMKTAREFWSMDYAERRSKYNDYPSDGRESIEQSAVENERIFSEVLQLLRDLRDGRVMVVATKRDI